MFFTINIDGNLDTNKFIFEVQFRGAKETDNDNQINFLLNVARELKNTLEKLTEFNPAEIGEKE